MRTIIHVEIVVVKAITSGPVLEKNKLFRFTIPKSFYFKNQFKICRGVEIDVDCVKQLFSISSPPRSKFQIRVNTEGKAKENENSI
jgi:hypothetical protein